MSDNTTDQPNGQAASAEDSPPTAAARPAQSAGKSSINEQPSPPTTATSTPRTVSWPGIAGLLVALLAAAGVGYLWNRQRAQQSLNEQFTATQRELEKRSAELGRVISDIGNLGAEDRKIEDSLSALTKRIERQLEELPARMTRIEGTLDKIPGVAGQARSAWLLAEAEYFLRIANAQLNLVGNVDISLRALELADAKIKDLGDPGLTRVRAKISDERTALKAVPRPDAEGIVLTLGSLAKTLDTLPLSHTAPDRYNARNDNVTETGWRRAWRVIVDALGSIISVRRNDETVVPLMSATEETLLVRSLDVELQLARLAVMRNEGTLYRQSLATVADRLEKYFDQDSQQVKTALATLDMLAKARLPEELPDISGSLNLLLNLGDEAAAP